MATISRINIDGINYKIKDTDVELLKNQVSSLKTNTENKSISIGYDSVAEGEGSVALGVGTKAIENYQTVIGKYNSDDNRAAFIIGDGTDNENRSHFFNVNWNGRVITKGPANAIEGASFVTILNNMNDSRTADVSAYKWGDGFCIADNMGVVRSYLRHNDLPEGQGIQLETRRYDTDAKNHFAYNGLRLNLKKDGTPTVNVSYPAAWRTALGLNTITMSQVSGGVKEFQNRAWTKIVETTVQPGQNLVFWQIEVPFFNDVKQNSDLEASWAVMKNRFTVASQTGGSGLGAIPADLENVFKYSCGTFHSILCKPGETDGVRTSNASSTLVHFSHTSSPGVLTGVREIDVDVATKVTLKAWQNYRKTMSSTSSNVINARLLIVRYSPYTT